MLAVGMVAFATLCGLGARLALGSDGLRNSFADLLFLIFIFL
jgi:hypothetical protein